MFSGAESKKEPVQETRPPRFLVVLEASMAGSGHAGGRRCWGWPRYFLHCVYQNAGNQICLFKINVFRKLISDGISYDCNPKPWRQLVCHLCISCHKLSDYYLLLHFAFSSGQSVQTVKCIQELQILLHIFIWISHVLNKCYALVRCYLHFVALYLWHVQWQWINLI